jgi:hypothetical protein
MKKNFLSIILLLAFSGNIYAKTDKNGLTGNPLQNAITISGGTNYYFGDIENTRRAFSEGWSNQVNFYGQFGYAKNIYKQNLKLKAAMLLGALNGQKNNGNAFKSIVFEPDLILEYYPFTQKSKRCNCSDKIIGFHLYGGVGFAISNVTFDAMKTHSLILKKNTFAPIGALGVGYKYDISERIAIGCEVGYRFVIGIDVVNLNLDGYPINQKNTKWSRWRDGFYTFGITTTYIF